MIAVECFCGQLSYTGGDHPCCVWWRSQGADHCVACAESRAAEYRHQRQAATCQCDEHARRRSA